MTTKVETNTGPSWPDATQFRRSLRWQFPLYVSLLIVLLMSVTGYIFTRQYVAEVTSHVVDRLMVQVRSHAVSAAKDILSPNGPDVLLLNSLCRQIASANPELYWTGIADEHGVFLAHTDVRFLTSGGLFQLPSAPTKSAQSADSSRAYVVRDTLYVYVPVREREITVGHFALAFPTTQIQKARNQSIITVASISLIVVLIGVPLIVLLMGRQLRPISTIVSHLREVNPTNLSLDIPVAGRNEFAYLAATLRVMGSRLKTAQEERVESERMIRDLEIAREIQAGILPRNYPSAPQFEFYGTYFSANEVGGDYYDFLQFDNDRLGFLIADVSGKSLPGMLVMLMTRDIVRKLAGSDRDPSLLMCEVNRELLRTIRKGMFVTMLYGLLDSRTGDVTLASAGHNPLIKISSETGTTSLLRPPGYPLGLIEPAVFDKRIKNETLHLGADDWLIQFTDGVNEARDPQGVEFGMTRLLNALLTRRELSPTDLIQQTLREHSTFVAGAPQQDDVTLVAMKWFGHECQPKHERVCEHAATC
jgi:serine phosphatase RsbU (regulator of sigma subunit)